MTNQFPLQRINFNIGGIDTVQSVAMAIVSMTTDPVVDKLGEAEAVRVPVHQRESVGLRDDGEKLHVIGRTSRQTSTDSGGGAMNKTRQHRNTVSRHCQHH